jgi:HD-like signal output (HDOD) protein
MATFLLVSALTIVLFAVIVYAFFSQNRDLNKKPVRRSVVRSEPQTAGLSSSPDLPSSDGISEPVESVSPPSAGGVDESTQSAQAWLRDGMALTFSGATSPQEKKTTLLRIEGVRDDVRRQVLAHITSLKNFDSVYQMQRMLGDPKTTMANLSLMITSDPLLSAKVLQVANSPYYGMEQKLNSISHAIMIIGMVNLKAIIYHEGVLQVLKEKSFRNNPTMQTIWQHANYTSIYASYLHYLFDGLNMGNLFTLGLLHDIGKFIMMKLTPLPERSVEAIRKYSPNWTMSEEDEVYGINHALVGRMALRQWGLSPLIIETVTLHHAPVYCAPAELGLDHETLQYLLVVFLADQAARLFAGRADADARVDLLHPAYHGLIDQNKLSRLIVDKSLMGQIREAEAITGVYA